MTVSVFALAATLLLFTLLATVRIPWGPLWIPTFLSSTWGVALVPVGAILATLPWAIRRPRSTKSRALLAGTGVCVTLLAIFPVLHLARSVHDLPERLAASFGAAAQPLPNARPARAEHTIEIGRLLKLGMPDANVSTHTYADHPERELRLDLYRGSDHSNEARRPLVLVVHGGSWQRGSRRDFPGLNHWLAARGFVVAAVDYRLAPEFVSPAAVQDIDAALTYLARNAEELGIDVNQCFLLGRSAGGQIALTSGYTTEVVRIRGVVALYAPTDMVWSWEHSTDTTFIDGRAVVSAYLGGRPSEQELRYRAASPISLANANSPPTLLLHGTRDVLVAPEQSRRLARRLSELDVRHLHVELRGATHAFDYGFSSPAGQVATFAIDRFLTALVGE